MAFLNVFLTYIILLVIMAVAAGAAVALGINRRKKKNMEMAGKENGQAEQE